MNTVVFLGPSLPVTKAEEILAALYLPPARCGDFVSAITLYSPDRLVLVDGVFDRSLSVWHKEILFALSEGISVYGASSMGALRALETSDFGMRGYGEVYRMYVEGEIADDDEVALLHADASRDYMPLSIPMVNVRATLKAALVSGVIDGDLCSCMVEIAKSIYYQDRTLESIAFAARQIGIPAAKLDPILKYFEMQYVDIKRMDAIALLTKLAEDSTAPTLPEFAFKRSHLFQALLDRDRLVGRANGDTVALESIVSHAALSQPTFNDTASDAANRSLVLLFGEMFDVKPSAEEINDEQRRFCARSNLGTDEALNAWLAENNLSAAEFADLMSEQAVCRFLHKWLHVRQRYQRTTRSVLNYMRLCGTYGAAADEAAALDRVISSNYPDFVYTEIEQEAVAELLVEHVKATRTCIVDTDMFTWARDVGFGDPLHLSLELQRESLGRTVQTTSLRTTETDCKS